MKKLLTMLAVVTLVLTLSAGCTSRPDPDDQTPHSDAVTVWGNMMIDNYNPIDWNYAAQTNLFGSVYSTLVYSRFNDDGSVDCVGDLAISWEQENDGAVWVFHLNPDAKFSNGEPVTADDVKFTFEAYAKSPYSASKVTVVKDIEVRDEHTIAINTGEYNARAPWCWCQVAIVEAGAYQDDYDRYIAQQIGSGPYLLDHLDDATGNYTLIRNEDYWGQLPAMRKVNVRVIADPGNAIIALQSGEIDYAYMTGTQYDLVAGDDNIAVKQQPSGYGNWLLLNANVAPLDNKYLRQAIGYAINYEAQYDLAFGGRMNTENTSVFYSAAVDPLPQEVVRYSYDVEKAKELIAQSGLETPIDIGNFHGGSGGRAELIQQNLAEIGVICQPVTLENFAMLESYLKGDYSIGIMGGVGGDYKTAADMLFSMYGSGQSGNLLHYSNVVVDELLAELGRTQDKAKYDDLTKQILEIIVDDAAGFCVGRGAFYSIYNKDLKVPTCDTGLVRLCELSW